MPPLMSGRWSWVLLQVAFHPPAGWTGFLKDSLSAAFQVIEAEAEVLLGSVPLNSQDASSATYYWSKQVTSSA